MQDAGAEVIGNRPQMSLDEKSATIKIKRQEKIILPAAKRLSAARSMGDTAGIGGDSPLPWCPSNISVFDCLTE